LATCSFFEKTDFFIGEFSRGFRTETCRPQVSWFAFWAEDSFMAATHREEQAIFEAARQIEARPAREAYLQQVCGGDVPLVGRVQALLKAFEQSASFLEVPASGLAATQDEPRQERIGAVIGPYKLLEQIGEGGFGVVFMAEQSQPVRRRIALKILKPGMDTRQIVARFEAERQALAIMDHPNIAKVFDGGQTGTGRPYFVMDLVKGLPITDYCDQARLTTRQRLELFVQVCHAVQHAHQKGIIHRDLKPSNVLVTLQDGRPLVKVIDFGVAKALGQQLTDKTMFTGFAQMVGTPLYMSPEQAALSNVDVDTRSDIYSLGVLLYELLTGTTPFDKERLRQASYDELRRIIREEEPPKPSTRISTLGQAATTMSAQRQSDPTRLSRLCRGELDWIAMKALDKDRNRRYETANGLALDVERFLRDEPVQACPPSAWYRLGKFVRRHRGAVVAASLVLLALVGGVIGTTVGLLRAEDERRVAQQRLKQVEKANEILGSIFKDLNPATAEKENKPLQALLGERLDQATAQLEGEIIGDPRAVARMQMTLGESLLGLAYPEKAIRLFVKARSTFTAQLGADHPDTLQSMNDLAEGYRYAAKFDLALPLFAETLERRKVRLGADHPDTLDSMNNLALGYRDAEKYDLALPMFEETLERKKAKLSPDDPSTLNTMNKLADTYRAAGKLDRALPVLEETLRRRRAKLGADHLDTLESMNDLALCYWSMGKLDRALPLCEETVELLKTKLGVDHPHTLRGMNNLALAYRDAHKSNLVVPLFEETVRRTRAKLGPDHPDTLLYMNNLSRAYLQAGQPAKAEPLLRECLAGREKQEPDAWRTFEARSMLGAALMGQKNYLGAEPLCRAGYQGMNEREAKIPQQYKVRLSEALERLVQLYEAMGNKEEVRKWQKKLVDAQAAEKPAANAR
jgi:serine/threonine protein kinase